MSRALCCFCREEAVSDGGASVKTKRSSEKLDAKIADPERNGEEVVNPSTAENEVESRKLDTKIAVPEQNGEEVVNLRSFDGSWVNPDSGEVHTVQGATCSAGNFTQLPDGKGCILDVHGEVRRGELSCDGLTITWENDDTWCRQGSKFDKAALEADSVPSVVVVPAVEPVLAQPVKESASVSAVEKAPAKGQQQPVARSGCRFDGLWTNHDTGEVHTVEGSSCSAGKFTAEADGIQCSLDVNGEVSRGELSSDGRTITWENDEMWFCEAPIE